MVIALVPSSIDAQLADRPVSVGIATTQQPSPTQIGNALFSPGASAVCTVISTPVDGIAIEVETVASQSFPSAGNSYVILSTGDASAAVPGPASSFLTFSNGNPDALPYPADVLDPFGDNANDVAVFVVSCNIPLTATTLSFDWTFGSEEEPFFTPDDFADYFRTTGTFGNIVTLPSGPSVTSNLLDDSTHENPVTGSSAIPLAPFPSPDDTALNAVLCTGTASVACAQPETTTLSLVAFQGTTITIGFEVGDDLDDTLDSAAFIDNFNCDCIVVGGALIPLDTTALLLAGAQMNAAWMIPVIVSAAGFAILIARKF